MKNKNCSTCEHYQVKNRLIKNFGTEEKTNFYAMECLNLVHPIEDCVLKDFKYHVEITILPISPNTNPQ